MKSRHAETRMQQRAVPPLVVNWLQQYGEEKHDHRGAVIRYFSKQSKRALQRDIGNLPIKRMSDYLGTYLIERDGVVITVGHRYKRIKRH